MIGATPRRLGTSPTRIYDWVKLLKTGKVCHLSNKSVFIGSVPAPFHTNKGSGATSERGCWRAGRVQAYLALMAAWDTDECAEQLLPPSGAPVLNVSYIASPPRP